MSKFKCQVLINTVASPDQRVFNVSLISQKESIKSHKGAVILTAWLNIKLTLFLLKYFAIVMTMVVKMFVIVIMILMNELLSKQVDFNS